jgi:5-methylcytosine-specific restriction enzyme subunit McrC
VLKAQVSTHLDHGRRVPMRPDLLFTRDGRTVYVGDIKYKLSTTGIARNSDYYQLLAYTTALDLNQGVLIYCLDGGEQPPRGVTVRYVGTELISYLLDVSGPVGAIERSMRDLAAFVTAHSADFL